MALNLMYTLSGIREANAAHGSASRDNFFGQEGDMMDYRLMHKNISVMKFTLDDMTCSIMRIGEIYNKDHIPVGIPHKKGAVDRGALNAWWKGRAIPASRQGLKNALLALDLPSADYLLDKAFGLSLSDQYWICPEAFHLK